jgi:hypothetical protein
MHAATACVDIDLDLHQLGELKGQQWSNRASTEATQYCHAVMKMDAAD